MMSEHWSTRIQPARPQSSVLVTFDDDGRPRRKFVPVRAPDSRPDADVAAEAVEIVSGWRGVTNVRAVQISRGDGELRDLQPARRVQ